MERVEKELGFVFPKRHRSVFEACLFSELKWVFLSVFSDVGGVIPFSFNITF